MVLRNNNYYKKNLKSIEELHKKKTHHNKIKKDRGNIIHAINASQYVSNTVSVKKKMLSD